MALTVSFELEDEDLEHLRQAMSRAQEVAQQSGADAVIAAGRDLLDQIKRQQVPSFIGARLAMLESLIKMVQDRDWALPQPECDRVLSAIAYFSDPQDLIPDTVPGIGFLDDAIMIELVCSQLRPEIDAYRDFCRFRERPSQHGVGDRKAWLQAKRKELQSHMHRREGREGARESGVRFSLW